MNTATEETATSREAESHEKGPCWRTGRARCAQEGEGGQEGQPREESAQGREKGGCAATAARPRRSSIC